MDKRSSGGGDGDGGHDVRLSKSLASLLRHNLHKVYRYLSDEEIAEATSCGYVSIEAVLKLSQFKRYCLADIQRVCQLDGKQRYSIRRNPRAPPDDGREGLHQDPADYQIRANQGHSVQGVDPGLRKLESGAPEVGTLEVIHGTDRGALDRILQSGGLNRMSRNHIHFSKGLPGDSGVISGMRKGCQVCIYIDLEAAMAAGFEFYESANGVILCPGDSNGFLPTALFSKVVDRKSGQSIDIPRT